MQNYLDFVRRAVHIDRTLHFSPLWMSARIECFVDDLQNMNAGCWYGVEGGYKLSSGKIYFKKYFPHVCGWLHKFFSMHRHFSIFVCENTSDYLFHSETNHLQGYAQILNWIQLHENWKEKWKSISIMHLHKLSSFFFLS